MPDLTVRSYSPSQIVATFGTVVVTGYAEGTFIKIARNGAAFEKHRGSDGSIDRINKNAFDYTVTLTLKQTSPLNAIFAGLLLADQISNAGILPLTIKDLGGATLFTAAQAWIAKDPDQEFSDSLTNREWTFETGVAANLIGGN